MESKQLRLAERIACERAGEKTSWEINNSQISYLCKIPYNRFENPVFCILFFGRDGFYAAQRLLSFGPAF